MRFTRHTGIDYSGAQTPIHFWSFDGFDVPEDRSVIAEVYPPLSLLELRKCRLEGWILGVC